MTKEEPFPRYVRRAIGAASRAARSARRGPRPRLTGLVVLD